MEAMLNLKPPITHPLQRKNKLIFWLIFIFIGIFNHRVEGQIIETKELFRTIVKNDRELMKAKKIFLTNRPLHFYMDSNLYNVVKSTMHNIDPYAELRQLIDSINSKKNDNWDFTSEKLKIYKDNNEASQKLEFELYNEKKHWKYIRLKCSPILCNKGLYMVSYSLNFGGLSGYSKIMVFEIKKNKIKVLKLIRIPGVG